MVRSNLAAKQASQSLVGYNQYPLFRAALNGCPAAGLSRSQLHLIAMIPAAERRVMLEVEAIMEEITNGFMPMMEKLARFFAFHREGFEEGDLLGEAWLALQRAVYGYDNSKYKIVTYFWRTLQRELQRYTLGNRNGGLTSRSSEYYDILRAVLDAERVLFQELKRDPQPDEVAHKMVPDLQGGEFDRLLEKVEGVMRQVTPAGNPHRRRNEGTEQGDVSVSVVEKDRLEDASLMAVQGAWDAKHELNGVLSAAEISDIGRAALLARAMETPITDIAKELGTTSDNIKRVLYVERRKLRRIA